jgi:hypothetical protein
MVLGPSKGDFVIIVKIFLYFVAVNFGSLAKAQAVQAYGNGPTSENEIYRNANDKNVLVTFEAGRSTISSSDQAKLKTLITSTEKSEINKIEIAAWSDESVPRKNEKLSPASRNLAKQRIDNLKKYFKDNFKLTKVSTFNMAESSNWLTRALTTDDAELKSFFIKRATPPIAREDFVFIKKNGGLSKAAVVLVKE